MQKKTSATEITTPRPTTTTTRTATSSKNGWTVEQKEHYDEWAKHYETYAKWLAAEPEKHQLFNMSVRNIDRRRQVAYYRGFVDAISHVIAVVQNSFESSSPSGAQTKVRSDNAMQTFSEYCFLLLGCLATQIVEAHKRLAPTQAAKHNITADCRVAENFGAQSDNLESQPLYSVAYDALPSAKSFDFYIGFRDGFTQIGKIVERLYDSESTFKAPFNTLKAIFFLQSGFCIGLMIENWPRHLVPSAATKFSDQQQRRFGSDSDGDSGREQR